MIKHTPGPWEIEKESDSYSIVNRTIPAPDDSWCVAEVYENECGKANANLIAASPKLLEALEALLPIAVEGNEYIPINCLTEIELARKAIARAKGESQ